MNLNKKLIWIWDNFYSNPIFYIYNMSIYHIFIIIFTLFLGIKINSQTFVQLSIESIKIDITQNFFKSLVFSTVIIILDLIFFIIIATEFKRLKLSTFKIIFIEIFIFYISFSYPFLRSTLFFLTLNSLQIFIPYKLMKAMPFYLFNIIFITSSYIIIIKLLYEVFIVPLIIVISFI